MLNLSANQADISGLTHVNKNYLAAKVFCHPQVWHLAAFSLMSISNFPLQTGHFKGDPSPFPQQPEPHGANKRLFQIVQYDCSRKPRK